jgi:hypothetical protein
MTILRTNTIAGIGETFGPLLDGDLEFNSQNYIVLPKGSSNQQGVLRTTEDVIGVGGTYYDNLVLAMPFNEATGFRDVSSRNRNPGAYGNVAISTAQSKYYGSSAYFDGTGDYLSIADRGDFKFGTGDFTIEMWINPSTIDTSSQTDSIACIMDFDATAGFGSDAWFAIHQNNASIKFAYSSVDKITSSSFLTSNTWFHLSLVRFNGTFTMYANGSSVGTITESKDFSDALTRSLFIGKQILSSTQRHFNGYIQDFRIYKGLAKYTANFTPPERIAEIGVGFKAGQLRYNTDSSKVELYDGSQWTEVQSSRPDLNGGARGLFGGGRNPAFVTAIEYITISSTGNSQTFGDLTAGRQNLGGFSSSTRGVFVGGETFSNIMDYVTISSTGNAQDFGDLLTPTQYSDGTSNSTRGLAILGYVPGPGNTNAVEYVTIASTGDSKDFGDLTIARRASRSSSSPTRAVIGGGLSPAGENTIDFMTISTLGDAQDFGDLTNLQWDGESCSNATRALWGGGVTNPSPDKLNVIQYITISTTGNAQNFGDLTAELGLNHSCSSSTRGVWAGGQTPTSPYPHSNIISYVTLLTQGNAVDFGDLATTRSWGTGISNAHGGL